MTDRERYASLMKQDVDTLAKLAFDMEIAIPRDAYHNPTGSKREIVAALMGECLGCPQPKANVKYSYKGSDYTFNTKPTGGPCLTCPQ